MKKLLFLFMTLNIFAQTPGNGVTDVDGNIYTSVIIGSQEWMVENLHVSKFRNGEIIPQFTGGSSAGHWCFYQNDFDYGQIYGKIYDGRALIDSRGLAPEGWRIPSDEDWDTLINHLGGASIAGGKMKSTILWQSPNTGATNEAAFSALPALGTYQDRTFQSTSFIGTITTFYSTSPDSVGYPDSAYYLSSDSAAITHFIYPGSAYFAVRCLKGESLNTTEISKHAIKIYPNPTNDELHIQLGSGKFTVIIYTLLGQEIGKISLDKIYTINMAKFGKGVYLLKIFNASDIILDSQKIIVK